MADGAALIARSCTDRAVAYADLVVSGELPSCRKVMQACQRFLDDLERQCTPDFPYVFDPEAAEHMAAFIEAMPHIKGRWAARRELVQLDDWQCFLIANIAGWVHVSTGMRRFKTAYVEVPRKQGKSTLLSAMGLYFLIVDGEPGAEVYSAASSSDQARIVFESARNMILRAEVEGKPAVEALGLTVEQHRIKTPDEAAVFRPVAAQTKSQDGKNPHCAIVDELHEHQNRDVWDSMDSALGAREQPLLIAITTAGSNTAGVCYEQRTYLTRILNRTQVDEEYFGLIYEADEGDDPGDPLTWAKANPGLGRAKSLEYMQRQWTKASASPVAMGEFLRKHLDIWTSVGASALDLTKWRAAFDPDLKISDFAGEPCFVGVDLATRQDFADVVVVFLRGRKLFAFARHFLNRAVIEAPGNEQLLAWANEGRILTTPEAGELDLNMVQAYVLSLIGVASDEFDFPLLNLNVQQVIYDPQFAHQMVATFEAKGLTCVELQTKAKNMNEPFNRLISAVDDGRLVTDGDPVLEWMAGNVLQKRVLGGDYIFPTRANPEDKIDGVVALINALWAIEYPDEEEAVVSPWDDPEFSLVAP